MEGGERASDGADGARIGLARPLHPACSIMSFMPRAPRFCTPHAQAALLRSPPRPSIHRRSVPAALPAGAGRLPHRRATLERAEGVPDGRSGAPIPPGEQKTRGNSSSREQPKE